MSKPEELHLIDPARGIPGYREEEKPDGAVYAFFERGGKTYALQASAEDMAKFGGRAREKLRYSMALTYVLLELGDGDAERGEARYRELHQTQVALTFARERAFESTGIRVLP